MTSLAICVLFLAFGTALAFPFVTSANNHPGSLPDTMLLGHGQGLVVMTTNKNLKEKSYEKRDLGSVNLEDYPPVDPAPSSKAAVKSGPIEHGTPLMPYVPRPTPPPRPKHGGSP